MRAIALVASVVGVVACATTRPGPASRAEAKDSGAAPSAGPAPRAVWPRAAELAEWTPAAPAFASAGHHGASVEVEVRVPPEWVEAYRVLPPGGRLPDGSIVAALHRRGAADVDVYVLALDPDGWSFLVLDSAGRVEREGRLADCARCHAEAPRGGLFGLPSRGEPGASRGP